MRRCGRGIPIMHIPRQPIIILDIVAIRLIQPVLVSFATTIHIRVKKFTIFRNHVVLRRARHKKSPPDIENTVGMDRCGVV